MAKLGAYEFPEIGLVESIDLGKKIAREFAGEVSRQGLARSLGMSERGGAFSARLGALRMWGVVGGRSRIRVTRDGLRAVTPLSEKESEDAKIHLARHVALFTEMSSRFGELPYTPDRFAVLLEELTGADRTEVARRLALIDRIFSEARPYLPKETTVQAAQSAPQLEGDPAESVSNEIGSTDSAGSINFANADASEAQTLNASETLVRSTIIGNRIELGLPDGKLSLPETLANLDAALTVLWARRQLVAAIDAADGKSTPVPPRDFSR
ncbi:MAG: hypothetical protein QGF24_09725 [Dehalococcoidia bacterium]|nr:hypothetical protein [Dehalococcoidia bacterium]